MENWIHERLSDLLGFSIPDDLIQYIMSMKSSRDIEDYLGTLLDFSDAKHKVFLTDLLQRRQNGNRPINPTPSNILAKKKKSPKNALQYCSIEPIEQKVPEVLNNEIIGGVQKKSKFVNLYSPEGRNREVVLLKGRHHCDCQASKHKLINNCLQCGRIVCEQEGSGPCLVCGSLVCSKEEQQVLTNNNKRSNSLYNQLMEQKKPQGWEAALAQRNRLLDYDQTCEKRTVVIDDENDYFMNSSVWLSKSEREKLQKHEKEMQERRHASRLSQKVTLDFAGRQVVQEADFDPEIEETILREMALDNDKQRGIMNCSNYNVNGGDNVHPDLDGMAPQFDDNVLLHLETQSQSNNLTPINSMSVTRLQDKEIQEMSDKGVCLSMHQPWASLLVAGIKLHEGRSWYTAHRGRLWIAATAKAVDLEEIKTMEQTYKLLYNNENIKFPAQYPSGCLLGCVSVNDCLPQDEYRVKYPNGESESPYVFICDDAQLLPIRFPVKGQHKIYKLDSKIHQAAFKSLQRMAKLRAEA